MAAWNSRGLRGSTFEELINQTNEQYEQMNLALIQKNTDAYYSCKKLIREADILRLHTLIK